MKRQPRRAHPLSNPGKSRFSGAIPRRVVKKYLSVPNGFGRLYSENQQGKQNETNLNYSAVHNWIVFDIEWARRRSRKVC
jgi:hypothetical protein